MKRTLTLLSTVFLILLIFAPDSQARYYNPQTGRYLTPDPIGPNGGINLYIYTENNPINFTDPNGLFPDSVSAKVTTLVGHG